MKLEQRMIDSEEEKGQYNLQWRKRGENKRGREESLAGNYSVVIKNDVELCLSTWSDVQNMLNSKHRFQNKTGIIPFILKA